MEDIKPVPKKKAAPKPKKEKVKPELDEDGNPIKKKVRCFLLFCSHSFLY